MTASDRLSASVGPVRVLLSEVEENEAVAEEDWFSCSGEGKEEREEEEKEEEEEEEEIKDEEIEREEEEESNGPQRFRWTREDMCIGR